MCLNFGIGVLLLTPTVAAVTHTLGGGRREHADVWRDVLRQFEIFSSSVL